MKENTAREFEETRAREVALCKEREDALVKQIEALKGSGGTVGREFNDDDFSDNDPGGT